MGFGLRVPGFGLRVQSFGLRVACFGLGGEVEAELVDDVAVVVVDDEGVAGEDGSPGEEEIVELVVVEGFDGTGLVDFVPVRFGFDVGGFLLTGLLEEFLGGVWADGNVGRRTG